MKHPLRPVNSELAYFASLISDAVEGERPAGLTPVEFLRRLDFHGITLLAHQNGRIPQDVLPMLAGRKAMMVANEALKRQAMIELFDAFASAGLHRSILFKGGALAYCVYTEPWLRPRSDIDLLIEQEQHPAFADVLFELGYQKLFAMEGELVSYQHTYSKRLAGQSVMNVDVHWRINNRQVLANSYHLQELLDSASGLEALSNSIRVPHHIDSLLIASLHRLGHHNKEERLTWLHDVHQICNKLSDQDWDLLCQKARAKKLSGITLDALNYAERFFATPVPSRCMQSLRKAAESREASQVFLQRDLPEWRYFLADLNALSKFSDKVKLISENVLPSKHYVRQQMGSRSALFAYLKRAWRGIRRIVN